MNIRGFEVPQAFPNLKSNGGRHVKDNVRLVDISQLNTIAQELYNGEQDVALLNELYTQSYHYIRYFLRSLVFKGKLPQQEIEDIAGEVVTKVISKSNQFDAEKGKFTTWITRITINAVYDYQRKRAKNIELLTESAIPDQPTATISSEVDPKFKTILRNLVESLPASQQRMIRLHYFEGLSCKEVATAMNVKTGNVTTTLHKARQNLLKKLKRYLHEDLFL